VSKETLSYQSLPAIAVDQLQKLGRDIRIARKRRRLSLSEMASRMMVNIKTLQRLEKGDPAVGIGIVVAALWVLGMYRRVGDLVAPESDRTGLQLDIQNQPRDFRKSKKRTEKFDF
jgi:transcriptional regulator with XRE-family HTH domain